MGQGSSSSSPNSSFSTYQPPEYQPPATVPVPDLSSDETLPRLHSSSVSDSQSLDSFPLDAAYAQTSPHSSRRPLASTRPATLQAVQLMSTTEVDLPLASLC